MVRTQLVRANSRRSPRVINFIKNYSFLLVFGVVLALSYVHLKVMTTNLSYEIWDNKKTEESLRLETQRLQAEYMKLLMPDKIAKQAEGRGFKFPTLDDAIYIQNTTLVGERNEP